MYVSVIWCSTASVALETLDAGRDFEAFHEYGAGPAYSCRTWFCPPAAGGNAAIPARATAIGQSFRGQGSHYTLNGHPSSNWPSPS